MLALFNLLRRSKVVFSIVILLIIAYVGYFWATHSTSTDNAYVVANMSYVSTPISGIIENIYVKNNESVHKGQLLIDIDPTEYKYALNVAESKLKQMKISYQKNIEKIQVSKESIEFAKSNLDLQKSRFDAATDLHQKGLLATITYYETKKDYINAQYLMSQANQNLKSAELDEKNIESSIKELFNQVQIARYNLASTKIYAPEDGIISNLHMVKGSPVNAYKPIVTLIDTSQWWVQANFQETDLAGVKKGDKAKIRLRMYLGDKVYHGTVEDTNWAVGRRADDSADLLQSVPQENQWLLLPQRFPVMIKIDKPDPNFPLHVGASAYVTIEPTK
ncbi:HlyD family secretion protein [Cysteiniphilum halobium]|uniref:HlyD family secretion protein n=1 Tax=Cysteiniphilum halobium TaxID=2219059 RepID=UPI000E65BA5F|nr:HlyD family secretion protein [Cysteiniphilum halobium]